ncbi:MAG: hypothetical protein JRG96_14660 [Deltaproteobacteria bacterium]|nr:hypothetical protein [Deltaproteobacteria bacterium]MBW2420117.1 hypothetical protein [Deltaproteobacteria bacterium]
MDRRSTRASRFVASAALIPGLVFLVTAPALAGDDNNDPWDPAMSTSDTMDRHHAESIDPDSLVVESEDLDDHLSHSENPDDLVMESGDPDERLAESESLDSHQGHSENLSDLETVAPDDGYEPIVPASQADWEPTDNPRVVVARDRVIRAEERVSRARSRYSEMMDRNYPRGAARERIVRERDESETALYKARGELEALDSGS